MKTFCIGRRILHSENNHLPRTAFTVLHLFCLQHPATMPIQCRKQLKSFPLLWSTGCSNSSGKSVPSAKVQQPATEASLISNMTPLWMEPEISGWTSFAEKSQIASRLNLALLIHVHMFFWFELVSLLCAMFCVAGTALLSTYYLAQVCHLLGSGCWLT